MRQAKHTPGPWHAEGFKQHESMADCGVVAVPRDGHGYAICRSPRFATKEEWTANARLIAAAPDMLAACKFKPTDRHRRADCPDLASSLRVLATEIAEGRAGAGWAHSLGVIADGIEAAVNKAEGQS